MFRAIYFTSALLFLAFILLPLGAVFMRALPLGVAPWLSATSRDALTLSLVTATTTTLLALLVGTPFAYALARKNFRGRNLVEALVDLPVVLPPAVAGIALLLTFGRQGILGAPLTRLGIQIPFTTLAVVLAQTFVAAPLYVRAARSAFASIDPRLEQMSAVLGISNARTFARVTLPLATPNLLGGALTCWARAIGEFGATILFAGNLPRITQTMPLAVYTGLEGELDSALALSVSLIVISFAVLAGVRLVRVESQM